MAILPIECRGTRVCIRDGICRRRDTKQAGDGTRSLEMTTHGTLDRSRPYLWPNLQTVILQMDENERGLRSRDIRAPTASVVGCPSRRGNDQVDAIANH